MVACGVPETRYEREQRRNREVCRPLIKMLNNSLVEVEGKGFVVGLVKAIQRITELSKTGLLDSRVARFSAADIEKTKQVVDGKALYSTPESPWAERERLVRSVQELVRRSIPEGLGLVRMPSEGGGEWVWTGSPAASLLMEVVTVDRKHLLNRVRQCARCGLWFYDSPNVNYCKKHRTSNIRVAVKRERDRTEMEGLNVSL
jgi:hypothetical protein